VGVLLTVAALPLGDMPLTAGPVLAPDGKVIAVPGDLGGGVKIVDAQTGKVQRTDQPPMSWVMTAAFSPDGTRLAIGGGDLYHGDVAMLDAGSGKLLWVERDIGHHHEVCLAWAPDGKTLCASCSDGELKILDAANGKLKRALPAKAVTAVAYSADGKKIAAVCWQGVPADDRKAEVRVWNAESGKLLQTLAATHSRLAFSPDGTTLAGTARNNDTVTLWELKTGQARHVLQGESPKSHMADVCFSPDGAMLVTYDRHALYLWDAQTGKLLSKLGEAESATITFSADGKSLIGVRTNGRTVWQVENLLK
jgi:WD40 repeat protein